MLDLAEADDVLVEAHQHALHYYNWRRYCTRLQAIYEKAVDDTENLLAPLREQLRSDITAERGRQALTEKAVADALRCEGEARSAMADLRKKKRKLDNAKDVLATLDVRLALIKSILHVPGYNA